MIKRFLTHVFQILSTLSCAKHLFKQTQAILYSESRAAALVVVLQTKMIQELPLCQEQVERPSFKLLSVKRFPMRKDKKEEGGAKDNRVPFTVEEYLLQMYTILKALWREIYMIVHVTLFIFPLLLKQTKFTDIPSSKKRHVFFQQTLNENMKLSPPGVMTFQIRSIFSKLLPERCWGL